MFGCVCFVLWPSGFRSDASLQYARFQYTYPPRSDFLDASGNQLTSEVVACVTFHSTFQSSVAKGKMSKMTTAQLLGLDSSMFKRSERPDVFTHSIEIPCLSQSILSSLVASAD